MSKPKVLVIGPIALVEPFCRRSLAGGHQVWGVSRSKSPTKSFFLIAGRRRWWQSSATAENFSFQAVDLNSQLNDLLDLIDRVQPELVVNFAAQGTVAESWLNPTHWYRTNVVAQAALHDALRQKPFLQIRACHHAGGVWHRWWMDQRAQPLQSQHLCREPGGL